MPQPLWYRAVCRACQTALYLVYFLIPALRPRILNGKNAVLGLPAFIKGKRLQRPLLVTDVGIMQIGLANGLIEKLKTEGLQATVYKDVQPNPTLDQVEQAYALYKQNKCDCIIGFGGGSPMDCAKLVGVRVVRPRTPLSWMRGIVKVLWPLPPLFEVPTTAGTGSEVTFAAVVVDAKTKSKYAVIDPFLVPRYAVHDPVLTVGLPKFVTATTGLDALAHAVEAFTNIFQTRQTREAATMSVRLIFNNLERACAEPDNLVARANMLEAAYLGGVAFTRAYVGNVHAVAHQLGGLYGVPHGLATGLILPHVMEMYGAAAHASLAKLGEVIGFCKGTTAHKAKQFIKAIKRLNEAVGVPRRLSETSNAAWRIREEDVPKIVAAALAEANPLYPVPVIFNAEDFTTLVRDIM